MSAGRISIDKEKCKGCYLCVRACPKGSIAADTQANAQGVFPAKAVAECTACGNCFMVCPDMCITVFARERAGVPGDKLR